MKEDSAFTKEVEVKVKSIAEAGMISDKRELLVKVGKELGYEFNKGDLEINVDDREMSDAELEKVAGGNFIDDFFEDLAEFFKELESMGF